MQTTRRGALRTLAAATALCAVLIARPAAHAACSPAADEAPRPSIGLALGGGGARGVAHAGVLRALEDMRIPIDCIAGTSMGAVVGGLYAAGLAPDELERELTGMDWTAIFLGRPPRIDWPSHRRREDVGFLARFPLGVRGGEVILPGGLIEGQELEIVLRRHTVRAAPGRIDFDHLPIPFRALAADLESGEAIVLGEGDLAGAIRASIAIPGAFAPVEIGGRLLVDGGIAANLPVAAVRAMGADLVIAVDVGAPETDRTELLSAFQAPRQVTNLFIRQRTEAQLALLDPDDILIDASPPDMGPTDFHQSGDGIAAGEQAALAAHRELAPHSLSPAAFRIHLRSRPTPPSPPPTVTAVRVADDGEIAARLIRERIRQPVGAPFKRERLEQDLRRLYALDYFDSLSYRLEEDGASGHELIIDAVERRRGRHHLRMGLNLEEDFEGGSAYNLLLRHQRMPLNRRGGEWTNEVQAGERSLLRTALHLPLDYRGRWFLAPETKAEGYTVDRFTAGQRIARYRIRMAEARLAVGRTLFYNAEFRTGVTRTTGEVRTRIGEVDTEGEGTFHDGAAFAEFSFDTLDSSDFPTRGHTARAIWTRSHETLGANTPGRTASAEWFSAATFRSHTLGIGARYDTSREREDTAIHRLFPLGGFLNLSGYRRNELYGHHAALGRLVYYRGAGIVDAPIHLPIYLGGSLEAGNVWDDRAEISSRDLRRSGSLFIGADTAFGPLYLALGRTREGRTAFYFYLGRTF